VCAHELYLHAYDIFTGADPGFQVRRGEGAQLKKLRRVEGGANNFGVFRVKKHDFTPKKSYSFQLRREARKILGYSNFSLRYYEQHKRFAFL
jgi:hypothetical protein